MKWWGNKGINPEVRETRRSINSGLIRGGSNEGVNWGGRPQGGGAGTGTWKETRNLVVCSWSPNPHHTSIAASASSRVSRPRPFRLSTPIEL